MSSRVRRDGFTLVELLVVVSVLGLITAVIAAAFVVIIRTNPANSDRADDARSLLGLTNHLPQDVSSAAVNPDRGIDHIVVPGVFTSFDEPIGPPATAGLPAGCDLGPSSTVSLAGLYWSEGSSDFAVNYRLVDRGGWRIVRYSCSPDGSASLNVSSVLRDSATDPLTAPPVTVQKQQFWTSADPTATPYDDGLEFVVLTESGRELRIHSATDNPMEEPLGSLTTQPPPVVTSEINTPPTLVGQPQIEEIWAGQTKLMAFGVTDDDGDPVEILTVVPAASWPADWDLLITGRTFTVTVPGTATVGESHEIEFTATDNRSPAVVGQIIVTVTDPAVTGATTTTTLFQPPPPVPAPCVVSSVDVTSPVKRIDNKSDSALEQDVEILITRSGECLDLIATYWTDEPTVLESISFNDGDQAVIGMNDHLWAKGQRDICIRDGFGTPALACDRLNVT